MLNCSKKFNLHDAGKDNPACFNRVSFNIRDDALVFKRFDNLGGRID